MLCQEYRKWTYRAVSGDYCLTRAAELKGVIDKTVIKVVHVLVPP